METSVFPVFPEAWREFGCFGQREGREQRMNHYRIHTHLLDITLVIGIRSVYFIHL